MADHKDKADRLIKAQADRLLARAADDHAKEAFSIGSAERLLAASRSSPVTILSPQAPNMPQDCGSGRAARAYKGAPSGFWLLLARSRAGHLQKTSSKF